MAGMVQAATVNWNSGTLRRATSAEGGWATSGGIKNYVKTGTELAVSVFLVGESAYTTATGMSQADLYAAYGKTTPTSTGTTDAGVANYVAASTDATKGTDYYAVVIYTYTDTTYGEMYMATTATIAGTLIDNADNTYDVANIGNAIGAATSGGGWQAIPEPTSGMLLLVGCALMALKRKRA